MGTGRDILQFIPRMYGVKKTALPWDYDPNGWYNLSRFRTFTESLPDVPRFTIDLLGPNITRSIFFAIDPFVDLDNPNYEVALKANRTQKTSTAGYKRSSQNYADTVIDGTDGTPLNPYPPWGIGSQSHTGGTNVRSAQPVLTWVMNDTSYSSRRPLGIQYKGGEMDYVQIDLLFPDRYVRGYWSDTWNEISGPTYRQVTRQRSQSGEDVFPAGAWLSKSGYDQIIATEKARVDSLISTWGFKLYKRCRPEHRSFSGLREIAELKDLVPTIQSSVESVIAATKGLKLKEYSQLYLNAEFGWAPLVSDIQDLLSLPDKIAKRVNRILKGLDSEQTYRSQHILTESVSNPVSPSIENSLGGNYADSTVLSSCIRTVELNCSLRCTFKFPNVSLPTLNSQLTHEFWGLKPSPSDVYNLIPWTWLLDWASGLDDYIDCIDIAHNTQSFVKSCYLSGKSTLQARYRHTSKTLFGAQQYRKINGHTQNGPENGKQVFNSYEYGYDFRRYKRIDAVDLLGLDTPLNIENLGDQQSAIVFALLTQGENHNSSVYRN